MKQKPIIFAFILALLFLFLTFFIFLFSGERESQWRNQTMLRMMVPYDKNHPTGMAAEYFAKLVKEESNGELEILISYNTGTGSETEIITQLQFGGIAIAALDFLTLCKEIPEVNRFVETYETPEAAQTAYVQQKEEIQEFISKERMEILSFYRPDYRCIASKRAPERLNDFTGLKIHATKAAVLSVYLVKLGAEIETFERTDLLRAVDTGSIDGAEMSFLLYSRAGYDKVMPYVWIYEDILVPDMLVASTVSLGNLTDEQQQILQKCAQKTEAFQVEALIEAQKEWEELLNNGLY